MQQHMHVHIELITHTSARLTKLAELTSIVVRHMPCTGTCSRLKRLQEAKERALAFVEAAGYASCGGVQSQVEQI